jgi:hypothetical protein
MGWTFYNSSGEAMIIDGGVQNPAGANFDISSYKLVGNGGSTGITISANGEVTMAAQPAVLAYNSAQDANVTGNNTVATVDFNTEVFDQNSDFASDTFTAPVTGRYLISAAVRLSAYTASANDGHVRIVTSNRTYYNINLSHSESTTWVIQATVLADMDAADTCTIAAVVGGEGSDVVEIDADLGTRFSAYLVA